MGAEAQQDGREISIGRQNDKFVEPRWMVHRVQNIHRHQDIGAVLAARGQGRAINNGERRAGEEASLAAECCRVQVAIADQHAARELDQPRPQALHAPRIPANPARGPGAQRTHPPPGGQSYGERKVHIVEIDEQCGPDRIWRCGP